MALPFPLWLLWSLFMFVFHLVRPYFSPSPGGIKWQNKPPVHRTCDVIADLLFEHANTFRLQNGLQTLTRNNRLNVASWNHAYRMGVSGQFDHVLTDGLEPADRVQRSHYRWSAVRENIAWTNVWDTPEKIAQDTHDGWVASPSHCESLLASNVSELGVAVVKCHVDGSYYLVQNFAEPKILQLPSAKRPTATPARLARTMPAPKPSAAMTLEQFAKQHRQ